VEPGQVGASWAQMTNRAGYFILLNVAMGGAFPNALAGTAPPIGSFAIANTGGWTSWREVPGNVAAVTGTHSVYLTVDWFLFRH
jgi:hypothetical protein